MSETQQVARRDFDAWTSGDSDTVATVLSPDFRFTAGDLRIDGREAFLDSGAFPRDATVTMVAEAYQDDVAFQLYDATRGDRQCPHGHPYDDENTRMTPHGGRACRACNRAAQQRFRERVAGLSRPNG